MSRRGVEPGVTRLGRGILDWDSFPDRHRGWSGISDIVWKFTADHLSYALSALTSKHPAGVARERAPGYRASSSYFRGRSRLTLLRVIKAPLDGWQRRKGRKIGLPNGDESVTMALNTRI